MVIRPSKMRVSKEDQQEFSNMNAKANRQYELQKKTPINRILKAMHYFCGVCLITVIGC